MWARPERKPRRVSALHMFSHIGLPQMQMSLVRVPSAGVLGPPGEFRQQRFREHEATLEQEDTTSLVKGWQGWWVIEEQRFLKGAPPPEFGRRRRRRWDHFVREVLSRMHFWGTRDVTKIHFGWW